MTHLKKLADSRDPSGLRRGEQAQENLDLARKRTKKREEPDSAVSFLVSSWLSFFAP